MRSFIKMFVSILIVFFAVETIFAQIEKGKIEFSTAASFMSRKYEYSEEAWTSINVPIRLGYFITKNIEIEPELFFTKYKEEDVGFMAIGNVAFNFIPSGENGKAIPFLLGGFGYGNSGTFLPNFLMPGSEDKTWTVLNIGAGVKMFVADPVALRFEYKLQKLMGDTDATYHFVLTGISLFFE